MSDTYELRAVGLTLDCADPETLADFWQAALGFRQRQGNGTPYITLSDSPIRRPLNHLTLQKVPEAKVVKHRLHLDLFPSDADAMIARLVSLGATILRQESADAADHLGFSATVMADPEGGEFCVVRRRSASS